jgi:hypothetical protein
MSIFDFLGFNKKAIKKEYPYKNILHLWEDDNLMVELLVQENLEFIQQETERIHNFGKEHFDGSAFTDITPIGKKPFSTIDKLIDFSKIEKIITESGLQRIKQFIMQDVGLLEGDKAPVGFGTNRFAIMCNVKSGLIEDIWITGKPDNDIDRQLLFTALYKIGQTFGFFVVDWYKTKYYSLDTKDEIEEFIKNL